MPAHRLDIDTLYQLLDTQRQEQDLSWKRLATSLNITSKVFCRMAAGGAPDAHTLVALVLWLGWAPELSLLQQPRTGGVR
jgi:hypothetical protein